MKNSGQPDRSTCGRPIAGAETAQRGDHRPMATFPRETRPNSKEPIGDRACLTEYIRLLVQDANDVIDAGRRHLCGQVAVMPPGACEERGNKHKPVAVGDTNRERPVVEIVLAPQSDGQHALRR